MSYDIDAIRRSGGLAETAGRFGVSLKKNGREFWSCCPFHDEKTPSFSIYPSKAGIEKYHCFGCGAHGDVIDFVREIKGVSLQDACAILGGRKDSPENRAPIHIDRSLPYDGIKAISASDHPFSVGVSADLYNPKRGRMGCIKPSMVFEYRNRARRLSGLVLRRDFDGRKETPTVRFVRLPDGREVWARMPFDKPRPLYGLDRLGDEPQVFVVEGEKAADAGHRLTGRCFVSWPGGGKAVRYVDWSPLYGRNVVIWPDGDWAGIAAAEQIATLLSSHARARVLEGMPLAAAA
ncbi:MAG: CHC2 zinc finger domain-containing protein [Stappiaceae bacterium]